MKNIKIEENKIYLLGDWNVFTAQDIKDEINKISITDSTIDLSGVSSFDSSGVLLFISLINSMKDFKVINYTKEQKEMFDILKKQERKLIKKEKKSFLESLGRKFLNLWVLFLDFLDFFGKVVSNIFYNIFHPSNIRIKETVYHIEKSGFSALFIIGITSFLIGMVLAYQGSVQLAKFGADIFIVDTVSISLVRELGPLITAIVIAGRSGSAYTAEIGAMKMTEEISAMKTMNFNPINFLVLPRMFALMITLPFLIFFADILGIFGGMVASQLELGISFSQFIDRLSEVLDLKHFVLGIIKGPAFAFVIVMISTYRGFSVSNNTESLGLQTTASVVNSIFFVIALDALFSIIYTGFGI